MPSMGYRIFNPWDAQLGHGDFCEHLSDIERRCEALILEAYEHNVKQGKKGQARHIVCGIHREKDIHNWFNLAMNLPILRMKGVRCQAYAGAMGHAETLLSGEWRIANEKEEAACRAKDAAAAKDKMERLAKVATAQMVSLGTEIGRAMQSAKPA